MCASPIIQEDIKKILSTPLPWERFSGKTILITGASGALGSAMARTLLGLNDAHKLEKNCHVIALARDAATAESAFSSHLKRNDFSLLVQDVCDRVVYNEKIDFIVHAASQASPKYYGSDPVGTITANVLGTHNLLTLATDHKAEGFLFFSTSEVYGSVQLPQGVGIKETDMGSMDPATVRACYGESKRLGETLCVAWHHQHKLPVTMVRPFHIYGPGFKLDDGRVFADFAANIIQGQDIVMNSDGSAIRSFCYVADAVKAFFLILLKGVPGNAYNVGNPNGAISVKALAELLVSLFPEKKLKARFAAPDATSSYIHSTVNSVVPDISKVQKLGWQPETALAEGFTRMVRSYES